MSGDLENFLRQAAQRKPVQPPPREVVEILDDDIDIIEAEVLAPMKSQSQSLSQADSYGSNDENRLGNLGGDRTVDEVAKLDHRLGSLESTPTATDDAMEEASREKPKLDIKAMFTTKSIVNSVIFSEILKRPDF
ncbi:MAG: hypothetical protein ACI9G1_004086 [Pirellulaceae bacterium]|jgi:hypothetical protein